MKLFAVFFLFYLTLPAHGFVNQAVEGVEHCLFDFNPIGNILDTSQTPDISDIALAPRASFSNRVLVPGAPFSDWVLVPSTPFSNRVLVPERSLRRVWRGRYQTYGNVVALEIDQVENQLRFPGQYFDSETGLHYNRHRYYHLFIEWFIHQTPDGLEVAVMHKIGQKIAYPQHQTFETH